MNRAGIYIPDPNQTARTTLETLEYCCEIHTESMINRVEMDQMAHATQVRERHDTGWECRVDR